jgi:hypothetical protein
MVVVFPAATRRGNGHDLGLPSVFIEKEDTMTPYKIRIALAAITLVLAAVSAVDSASALDPGSALNPGTPMVVGSAYVNLGFDSFSHSFQWGP